MSGYRLRTMQREEWPLVAELIMLSTNAWYAANGKPPIFPGPPESTLLFCEVYEALDPGCCLLAFSEATGALAASCFYHPRDTHLSLGILNTHPNYFGRGAARVLLEAVIAIAESQNKPVRLVSSAINLDSYSLYNRYGFQPVTLFQDMALKAPPEGVECSLPECLKVRQAQEADLPAITALEEELAGLRREGDYRHFISNREGIWRVLVLEGAAPGRLEGFLASVAHPASRMIGPGAARTEAGAIALVAAQLNLHKGFSPVVLVPAHCSELVKQMYAWGARNCELHLSQVRGPFTVPKGVVFPTFMPETG